MTTTHTSDETLALFASGALDAAMRANVLAHLDRCEECSAAVLAANAHLREEAMAELQSRSSRRPWWLAAVAAAVIVALLAVPQWLRRRDPMAQLVAAAPAYERTIEPRLSGFPWAPYRGPMRAATPQTDIAQLKFGKVAADVMERENDHATGVAMLLLDHPDSAIARLEAAARASNDAKTWSDLAAARYTAATQLHRPALLPPALDAANEALRLSPRLPEALFNRALILERMGAAAEAKQAWARYLEVDGSSAWAHEASAR